MTVYVVVSRNYCTHYEARGSTSRKTVLSPSSAMPLPEDGEFARCGGERMEGVYYVAMWSIRRERQCEWRCWCIASSPCSALHTSRIALQLRRRVRLQKKVANLQRVLDIRALQAIARCGAASVVSVTKGNPGALHTILESSLPPSHLVLGLAEGKRADEHGNIHAGSREHETKSLTGAQSRPVKSGETRLRGVHDIRRAGHLQCRHDLLLETPPDASALGHVPHDGSKGRGEGYAVKCCSCARVQKRFRRTSLLLQRRVLDSVEAAGARLVGALGASVELRGNLKRLRAPVGEAKGGDANHSAGRGLKFAALGLAQRNVLHVCHQSHDCNCFSLLLKNGRLLKYSIVAL
mmetsp:Transcript_8403/g.17375  ORF Transcript_8403/g.17375 Transcript_8403/m.17375 type:complete len:350 (+) Transcript_8403:454-1503(+)